MKERKLLLTYYNQKKAAFCIEDDRLAQVSLSGNTDYSVGDIFVGRVKNIVRGMDAAFVEFSKGNVGFLSFSHLNSDAVLNRKNATDLKCGDELLVQISKEPLKTKEAALTTDISIAGKYVVIFPFGHGIHYSNKINDKGRSRLQETVSALIPKSEESGQGFIFRTNAVNATNEQLSAELQTLLCKVREILSISDKRTVFSCIYKEEEFFANVLKNLYIPDVTEIITDKKEIFEQMDAQSFPLRFYADDHIDMLRLYGMEERLKDAISRKVWLKSGAYLIIEPTEALTVIDVNSGKTSKARNKLSPEEFHHRVNCEAVSEILHQLRLRNISGIIIVDFLKTGQEYSQMLLEQLRLEAKKDSIQTIVIGMTALGLVEITRKKTEASLYEKLMKGNFFDET